MTRQIKKAHGYQEKMIRLIPSEIIATYMALNGIVPENNKIANSVIAGILLLIMPFYLEKVHKMKWGPQVWFMTISFVIWLYSIGTPFKFWGLYVPWVGSATIIIWTLIAPMFVTGDVD